MFEELKMNEEKSGLLVFKVNSVFELFTRLGLLVKYYG